jgi:hypothetical protein
LRRPKRAVSGFRSSSESWGKFGKFDYLDKFVYS